MAKIKRETLKKFGCHEKQVEELMLELGHTVENDHQQIDMMKLKIVGSRLCYGTWILFDFLSNGTVRRVGNLPTNPNAGLPFKVDLLGKVVMSD